MENVLQAPAHPTNFLELAARYARFAERNNAPSGLIAIYASHAQMDALLVETMVSLANDGHSLAVIVADNQFAAYELARRADDTKIKVARGETPHQMRQLVRRLLLTRASYSVAIVSGLLEPFYDEQVKWQLAQTLLTDTLQLLNELALTLHVFVLLTPAPKPTRRYLQAQVTRAVAHSIELPALETPANSSQERLF